MVSCLPYTVVILSEVLLLWWNLSVLMPPQPQRETTYERLSINTFIYVAGPEKHIPEMSSRNTFNNSHNIRQIIVEAYNVS